MNQNKDAVTGLVCPDCQGPIMMRVHLVDGDYQVVVWCEHCQQHQAFFPDWDDLIETYGYGVRGGDEDEVDELWDFVEHESGDPSLKSWALGVAEVLVQQGKWSPTSGDLVIQGDVAAYYESAWLEGNLVEGEHYRIVSPGTIE